ncbi:unnamed protein product [Lymnaea stagnalis]|uniref:Fibronectin type-III domain-containing protein n=1 Tax=Lymnaea stagnalis TaxID=6523 RepID=A0AAV2I4L7_LYMST
MGANQSNGLQERDRSGGHGGNKGQHSWAHSRAGERRTKAKPAPPLKPYAADVTHNSIALSWMPPRHDTNSIIAYMIEIANVGPHGDGQWKTVTKCCQGTNYDVRHLSNDTEYMFRVRAENVYGVGKPSAPSDIVTTKLCETMSELHGNLPTPATTTCSFTDTNTHCFKRRHSFNVHLDGGITKILTHSDIVINNYSSSSTTSALSGDNCDKSHTLSRAGAHRSSLQQNRKVGHPILLPGTGTNSLNRLRESRSSLKASDHPRNTAPRCSVTHKFRESRSSFGSTMSDSNGSTASTEDDLKKSNRGSAGSLQSSSSDITVSNHKDQCSEKGSKNSLSDSNMGNNCDAQLHQKNCDTVDSSHVSDQTATLVEKNNNTNILCDTKPETDLKLDSVDGDVGGDIYKLKEGLKNYELTEEKLKLHDLHPSNTNTFSTNVSLKGYYEHLENPWEKGESVGGVPEQIMAAPLSDDVKMAMINNSIKEDNHSDAESGYSETGSGYSPANLPSSDHRDFRTLRSVLQSSNMIVKSSKSLPDVVGMVLGENGETKMLPRGRLTTIVDADEEEEPVWIATL